MGMWHPDTIDGPVAHQIAACDSCEPDRRPRMFVCDYHEGWIAAIEALEVRRHVHWLWSNEPVAVCECGAVRSLGGEWVES